ncbi:hypothetical protein KR059_011886, partial [Drosophila kikkawai]
MQRLEANGCAEQMAESAMNQLQAACDNCMTAKRAHSRHRDSVYWWNHAIAAARTECIKARRRYQRSYRSSSHLERRPLCDTADRDPWGNAYRIIVKKI